MIWELPISLFIGVGLGTIILLWIMATIDPFFNPHPGWICLIGIASAAQISIPLAVSMILLQLAPQIWNWILSILGFLGCYLGLVKLSVAALI